MEFTSLGRSLLQGGDEGLFDHRLILLDEVGVDRQGEDQSMAVDCNLDRAAAMGDLESLRSQLLLGLSNATLHLLGLFEEFAYACHNASRLPTRPGESRSSRRPLPACHRGDRPQVGAMRPPRDLQIIGDFVAITWEDDREQCLRAELLRERSPSAENMGEVDILGQRWGGDGPRRFPGVVVTGLSRVGNYAVTFEFSDGHRTGIYSWEYLSAINDPK